MSDETERPEEAAPASEPVSSQSGGGGDPPSSTGMEQNIAALVANLLGPISGLIFVLIEKDNRFVKFNAWQALSFGGAYMVLQIVLSMASSVTLCISGLLSLLLVPVGLVIWILMMVKAYQNQKFKLPLFGDFAEQQADK